MTEIIIKSDDILDLAIDKREVIGGVKYQVDKITVRYDGGQPFEARLIDLDTWIETHTFKNPIEA